MTSQINQLQDSVLKQFAIRSFYALSIFILALVLGGCELLSNNSEDSNNKPPVVGSRQDGSKTVELNKGGVSVTQDNVHVENAGAVEQSSEKLLTYKNEELGFSFEYPEWFGEVEVSSDPKEPENSFDIAFSNVGVTIFGLSENYPDRKSVV